MSVRFYIGAMSAGGALSGLGLAAVATGHLSIAITLTTIGGLLGLSATLWLLKKELRR